MNIDLPFVVWTFRFSKDYFLPNGFYVWMGNQGLRQKNNSQVSDRVMRSSYCLLERKYSKA